MDSYLTVYDVAELLNISRQAVSVLCRSGELPALRVGRVYRISRSELDSFIARSMVVPSKQVDQSARAALDVA